LGHLGIPGIIGLENIGDICELIMVE